MSDFLQDRLDRIKANGTYRELPGTVEGIDFWSNDYLGFARLEGPTKEVLVGGGATGSRLISGDHQTYQSLEKAVAEVHGFPAALMFNSGYTAFLGLLSALLTRTDTIIYDELSHACCRDGIRLGSAKALRFQHNDLLHLRQRLEKVRTDGQTFVLTESRFSMDGDTAPLIEIADLCEEFGANLIVDEAHTSAINGANGEGMVAELALQRKVFANVITYGKAFGAHGAVVLGSQELHDYLVNTSRPFIYSTGMATSQWGCIGRAYKKLSKHHSSQREKLRYNIHQFAEAIKGKRMRTRIPTQDGPIQTVLMNGNEAVLKVEAACRAEGFLVKGIRSPTVAVGKERLRICLHAFNTADEIDRLVGILHRELMTFGPSV